MNVIREECKNINEYQVKIKFFEEIIKAQARLFVSYRVGGRPPQWVFDTLSKARKEGIDV